MNDITLHIGTPEWNDLMFTKYPTPCHGIVGFLKLYLAGKIFCAIQKFGNLNKNQNLKIIEVGCEAGFLLKYISSKFPKAELFGIDISVLALNKACQKLGNKAKLFYHDITESPFKISGAPDIIICSETLEHIPKVEKAVENLANMADKNTIIIITVPDQHSANVIKKLFIKIKLFKFFFPGLAPGTSEWHVHSFTRNNLSPLLEIYFHIIKYEKLFFHHLFLLKSLIGSK